MQISTLNRPTLWKSLLWKDFHQVRPAVLAILCSLLAIQILQLLVFSMGAMTGDPRHAFSATLLLAVLSPILVSLAASGMLIGHERQTGTWGWSSSLPVSWRHTLLSKLGVALFSGLLTLAPLLVVPAVAWGVWGSIGRSDWWFSNYNSPVMLLITLEVLVFFFVATLLFRETLTAMLIAALFVTTMQLSILAVSNTWFDPLFSRREGDGLVANQSLAIICQMLVVLGLGACVLAATYRWRWGVGQYVPLAWSRRSGDAAPPSLITLRQGTAPSEFRMLLSHAVQNSMSFRICVLAGVLGLGLVTRFGGEPMSAALVTIGAILLLGLTVFEGDQSRGRFRFLADRGVRVGRLVHARLLPPVGLALLVAVSVLLLLSYSDIWPSEGNLLVGAGIVAFWVGALSSLCFQKQVIAGTVAVLTMLVGVSVFALVFQGVYYPGDPWPYWAERYTLSLLFVFSVPYAYWAIHRLASRWIIDANPPLGRKYFATMMVAGLVPVVGALFLGPVLVPKVPWQGMPVAEIRSSPQVVVPRLVGVDSFLPVSAGPLVMDSRDLTSNFGETFELLLQKKPANGFGSEAEPLDEEELRVLASKVTQKLRDFDEQLQGSTQPEDYTAVSTSLDAHLRETAALTAFLVKIDQVEAAKLALDCNYRLRRLAAQQMAVDTVPARLYCNAVFFEDISDEHWRQLGSPADLLAKFRPTFSEELPQFRDWARSLATCNRAQLRGENVPSKIFSWYVYGYTWPRRYVPPLRWRQERILALQLAETLHAIDGSVGNVPVYDVFWNHYLNRLRLNSAQSNLRARLTNLPRGEETIPELIPLGQGDE